MKFYFILQMTVVKIDYESARLNNPSSGFIQKSNPVSRFIRFQRGSDIEKLFPTDPRETPINLYRKRKKNKPECTVRI